MKKIAYTSIISILSLLLFTGCGNNSDDNIINISILNSKPEIVNALNDIIEDFTEENSDINIKLVKYSSSISYKDKLNSLKALNNMPTLSLIDASQIKDYRDIAADLSSEEWVNNLSLGASDISKNSNGEIIAFPFSIEGAGFLYNKKVTDAAGIDINSINTIAELEDAFIKVNAIGKDALILSYEDWSLGDHFLSTFYSVDANKFTNKDEYFKNLKANVDTLAENPTLNGLLDVLDLMKKYNMYSDDPSIPSYDKCSEIFGKGEVGFWYMGNWASPSILSNSNGNSDFGVIPVPISNNDSDYGNNEVVAGVTKYFIIDKNKSAAQQEAAKKFLNYLVSTEKGNKFLVEDCGIITAFNNIEPLNNDPLVSELTNYLINNRAIEFMTSYLPAGNSDIIGSALVKYVNNEISRADLINQISEFWKEN